MAKLSQAQIDFANEFKPQTSAQTYSEQVPVGATQTPQAATPTTVVDTSTLAGVLAASNAAPGTLTSNYNAQYWSDVADASYNENVDGTPKPATSPVPSTPTTTDTPKTPDTTTLTDAQQQDRQNIFDAVQAQMQAWGILIPGDTNSQGLLNTLKSLAMSGAGADTVSLALQNSDAYKARFSGNEARKAAGLAVLSPADYIATEQAYDQILRGAGVPTGCYSSSADKAKLIGADVSASELQSRVDLAKQSISQADPFYTSTLQNLYGLSSGDMIAHVLDPAAALPLITQQVNSAQIAAEAARAGSGIGLPLANQLAGQGVTQAQAAQGFQQIATQQPALQSIASRYGAGLATEPNIGSALQAATFGTTVNGINQAQAQQQINLLKTAETSAFSGSAGAATGSLGPRDTSGQL